MSLPSPLALLRVVTGFDPVPPLALLRVVTGFDAVALPEEDGRDALDGCDALVRVVTGLGLADGLGAGATAPDATTARERLALVATGADEATDLAALRAPVALPGGPVATATWGRGP